MKALVVILIIASVTFALVHPIALKFTPESDFKRRRNVWFALTIIGFLSPNFWVFAVFAVPIYVWIGRKDSNPIAAYLLLMHVVPLVSVPLPTFGVVNELFSVDNYRLLCFCILMPAALRARRSPGTISGNRTADLLLLGYGLLQAVLFVPPNLATHEIFHDSATNMLRRFFLIFTDILVLYYAVSRSCNDRAKIADAQATFCVAGLVLALVAGVEHFKSWLLYVDLAREWNPGDTNYITAWLLRGDTLRAQASSGQALALGILLATAFGFWLYLQTREAKWRTRLLVGAVLWVGLFASMSRGPWIGAALIYLAYSALKPRAVSRLFKASFVIAAVLGAISISPVGEKMLNSLSFSGSQTDSSVTYRQRLFDRSLELIEEHPLFGDQLAMQEMEDLRQGQGIIDVVNTYIGVALFSGLVGLALFLGFILSAAVNLYRAAKSAATQDPDFGSLGLNLLACIIGLLFMIADCSLIYGVEKIFYILGALAVAFAGEARRGRDSVHARDLALVNGAGVPARRHPLTAHARPLARNAAPAKEKK
jgi:O-antigen ligase